MSQDVSGDCFLTFDLTSAYKVQHLVLYTSQSKTNESKSPKDDILNNLLTYDLVSAISGLFEQTIKASFEDCYEGFISITDPEITVIYSPFLLER